MLSLLFINIMRNTILIILCLIAGYNAVTAREFTDSVTVEFRTSHINIDPSFRDNEARINNIVNRFMADSTGLRYSLRSVNVVGAASPEGSISFNQYLSEKRAKAIFDLLHERGILTDSVANFSFLGRDWDGLRREVSEDPNVPDRKEVIGLLDNIVEGKTVADPLYQLKSLDGGRPYAYLYKRLFPSLRMSKVVFSYDRLLPLEDVNPVQPILLPEPPELICPEIETIYFLGEVKECKPFYLGLKTNLISDLLLIPHVGADLYVGRGWSVTADWMYGWWDKDRTHHYWRAYGGTVGARKWFGKKAAEKPLTGHHLGVYAGAVTYDFEFGGKGYMGGKPHGTLWDRCNIVTGVEYGYSLPVARRLNIDFSLGVGYMGGKVMEYVPKDGFYMWQSTHRLNWFGPTKAEVSLVWLVGCDNFNRKKGGRL